MNGPTLPEGMAQPQPTPCKRCGMILPSQAQAFYHCIGRGRTRTERTRQAEALLAQGIPRAHVARELGYSRERIRQIANRLKAEQAMPDLQADIREWRSLAIPPGHPERPFNGPVSRAQVRTLNLLDLWQEDLGLDSYYKAKVFLENLGYPGSGLPPGWKHARFWRCGDSELAEALKKGES